MDLSVILVTWNSLEVTAAALESIQRHTEGITYETFVIDNGTTKDDSVDELPKRFPWIRFTANGENRGFTKANNQGIRESTGRYILLLNNDTLQIENALGRAVEYMDAHPDVGVLGVMHRNHDEERSFQPSFYDFPRPGRETAALLGFRGKPSPPPAVEEQDCDWVCGSFLMMRRACLNQIGPLDERFFIYDEDIDWCLQAHKAGWKVRFWPGTSIVHLGAAANPFMRDKTLVMFRSHVSYLRKNHGLAAAAMFYLTMGLLLTMATMKQILKMLIGRAGWNDVLSRWRRQTSFLLMRPGKTGG